MPVENEYKFALYDPHQVLERTLGESHFPRFQIAQGYLRKGSRIRHLTDVQNGLTRYIFTYKQRVEDDVVEIETDIPKEDFDRLWPAAEKRIEKIRYKLTGLDHAWDVDFLKDGGRTYFSLAEVELAAEERTVPEAPEIIADFVLKGTGRHEKTLSNRRLSDPNYARWVLSELQEEAGIADKLRSFG